METQTLPQTDLSPDQLDWKLFNLIKYVTEHLYRKQHCYLNAKLEEMKSELTQCGINDGKVLVKCLQDMVNRHNGMLEQAITKIKAIRYDSWKRSNLFNGIGLDKNLCERLVKKYQHYEIHEIFRVYIDPSYQPKKKVQS